MTSIIKDKAAKASSKLVSKVTDDHGSEDSSGNEGTDGYGEKFILRVTASPGYDPANQVPIIVNGKDATSLENEFMHAKVKVRIRGFSGLPRESPSYTPYFDDPAHSDTQYSVGFSFVPKVDIAGDELWWGNDFDHPVRDRLPPGFKYAFGIVKSLIDPGIEADAYSDTPWLFAPALDCWFTFRIGDLLSPDQHTNIPHVEEEHPLEEGADGSGVEVRQRLGIPDGAKRRKFYLSEDKRKEFVFEKGRLYQGDFFNPYLDFSRLALRLPGFKLRVIKYLDNKTHNLRYVLKNRKTGDAYFVVNIALLFGEDMKQALQEEDQRSQRGRIQHPVVDPVVKKTGEFVAPPGTPASPVEEFHDAKSF